MQDCKLQTTFRLILEKGSEGVGECSFCRTHFCIQIWAAVIKSRLGKLRASGFLVYCQGNLYLAKMLLLLLPLRKFHHKRWWCKLLYRITDTPLLTLIVTELQKIEGESREQWSKGRIWSRWKSQAPQPGVFIVTSTHSQWEFMAAELNEHLQIGHIICIHFLVPKKSCKKTHAGKALNFLSWLKQCHLQSSLICLLTWSYKLTSPFSFYFCPPPPFFASLWQKK